MEKLNRFTKTHLMYSQLQLTQKHQVVKAKLIGK